MADAKIRMGSNNSSECCSSRCPGGMHTWVLCQQAVLHLILVLSLHFGCSSASLLLSAQEDQGELVGMGNPFYAGKMCNKALMPGSLGLFHAHVTKGGFMFWVGSEHKSSCELGLCTQGSFLSLGCKGNLRWLIHSSLSDLRYL